MEVWQLWLLLSLTAVVSPAVLVSDGNVLVPREVLESLADKFLTDESYLLEMKCRESVVHSWEYNTNITDENQEKMLQVRLESAVLRKESWKRIQKWKDIMSKITDEVVLRKFKFMSILGTAALPDEEYAKYTRVISDMSAIYSTAKVCSYQNPEKCDLSLDDLDDILRSSRDYDELTNVWKTWRDNSGKLVRQNYRDFVPLANKAAKANGFDNNGDMDLDSFESDNFRQQIGEVWQQLKPLYMQLHAYTRRNLRKVYGPEVITERGPIPAHLLGNMWAQQWSIDDLLLPYPGKTSIDVTPEMVRQGYTPQKMFELSDDFFASLNLTRMPEKFWQHSLLEDPGDRDVNCHASAWDFCNGEDFRIKQCTKVNMIDLITAHHEMGHIQYFLQYKDQPYIFRGGANGGFHEAVGDVLALSVATPKHLHKVGLLPEIHEDKEAEINFLLQMAIDKIVFLPFAYAMDSWRWGIFDGSIPEKDWNCGWWDLRYEIQGVKPPVIRTESDFDPGAKYHVAVNSPYIRYFVSYIIQFQFHKAMCLKAGEYDPNDPSKPLHKCDIYQSTEAGNVLGDMLKLGSSKPWPEAMAVLTGEGKMDANVIREYFKPLEDWLIENNEKHGEFVGWRPDGQYCVYETPAPQRQSCIQKQETG